MTASPLDATPSYWDQHAEDFQRDDAVNRAEWLGHPATQALHVRLLEGSPGDWLAARLHEPVERAVGLGCGTAAFELDQVARGKVRELLLFDVASGALELARQHSERLGITDRVHTYADDWVSSSTGRYGLVICRSSLHHALDMQAAVTRIRDLLLPGGLFFAHEYVGPNRFGYPAEHRDVAEALYRVLDPSLTCGQPVLPLPIPEAVAEADPTEAVESEILLATVHEHFEHLDVQPMGGALPFILWWGLRHDALWETEEGRLLVDLVHDIDQSMVRTGRLPT